MRKKFFTFFSIVIIGVLVLGSWVQSQYVTPILMYHSVDISEKPMGMTVSPENFRKQMNYLKDHGFQVIPLDRLVNSQIENKPLPPKSVAITFDDGYVDNYTHAFPVLRELEFPASIFLIVSEIGKPGYLNLEQIHEMERHKIVFGSHSFDHPYLPQLSVHEQTLQLIQSKKILENHLGHPIDTLAYPSGGFTDEIKVIAKNAGYKAALTTNRGKDRRNNDLFELKRLRFSNSDTELSMWAKLSGYYNLFRKTKSSH